MRNIIVQNLNLTNTPKVGEGDGITIMGGTNIFITHCTFTDCVDGMCDITNRADSVTVSWCRFRYVSQTTHCYVNLIGNSDSYTADMGRLHVTIHHCWFDQNCAERMPSVRFGRVHVYNNYYRSDSAAYCIRTRLYASVLVQNNYFEHVKNPWELGLSKASGTIDGKLYAADNNVSFMDTINGIRWLDGWYEDAAIISKLIPGLDVVGSLPTYSYTLDDNQVVKSKVMAGAGNVRSPLVLNPSSVDFGSIAVGNSVTRLVTATNASTTNAITITGVNTITGYSVVPNPFDAYPITLAPGTSQNFDVTFTPLSDGSFSGVIVFTHNAIYGSSSLSVTGNANRSVQFKVPIYFSGNRTTDLDTIWIGVNGDGPGGTIIDNTDYLDDNSQFGQYGEWRERTPVSSDGYDFISLIEYTLGGSKGYLYPWDFRGYKGITQVDTFDIFVYSNTHLLTPLTISWPSNLSLYGDLWLLEKRDLSEGWNYKFVANMTTTTSYTDNDSSYYGGGEGLYYHLIRYRSPIKLFLLTVNGMNGSVTKNPNQAALR